MEQKQTGENSAEPTGSSAAPEFNGQDQLVVVKAQSGNSHVGHVISDGPGVMRLMVTRPFNNQGRIVELPLEDVKSVDPLPEEDK